MKYDKNILVIIQARMGSSRLPGKVMMPLNNKPLIKYMVESFKKSECINDIIIATSLNEENDLFVEYLENEEIKYFRGSEENVLSRFAEICKIYKPDIVIRATADDPLMSIECLDEMLISHVEREADYTFMVGLPTGVSPEIIDASILCDISENKKLSSRDREHVTIYIKEHPNVYSLNFLLARDDLHHPEISLTIDTKEEFVKMNRVFEVLGDSISLENAIKYFSEIDED